MKIGIIGIGGRIKETVLPAIDALGSSATLTNVIAKTSREVAICGRESIHTNDDLNALNFEQLDLLIVAVPTKSVFNVLNRLRAFPNRKGTFLLIDTPPINLSKVWRRSVFSGYRGVGVGEDWIKLAPVLAIQQVVKSGRIGSLQHIELNRCGYRYHGLATIRHLAQANCIWRAKRKPLPNEEAVTQYTLVGGISASMTEPRNYESGYLTVSGTDGCISDQASSEIEGTIRIEYPESTSGWLQEVTIDGEAQPLDDIDRRMQLMSRQHLVDDSRVNRLKIRAFARLVEDMMAGTVSYPISQGIYDYLATCCCEKLGRFVDFRLPLGPGSLLRIFLGR